VVPAVGGTSIIHPFHPSIHPSIHPSRTIKADARELFLGLILGSGPKRFLFPFYPKTKKNMLLG